MKRFKYMALAALVAFAACDEGTDVVVDVPVTGDIAGVVTIEGAAVSGVSVALSSGATTTTDGSGAYSFSGVAAGAYTITISGFATDATFSSTSKAATIVTTGQVATVNFDGAYVRTSAILGSVAAGGSGLAGVSVSIGASTTQTDANGQYSFSGLRAGTYTVTVTGFNAQQYAFATSTQNITLGVGESKVVSFNGQLLATSTISGTLFIDGNGNGNMDGGEPPIAKAGIEVALEIAINDTLWTTTDANGAYSFPDLAEGQYKVICCVRGGIPGAFSQSGDVRYGAAATSGAATTVNFPFVVTTQYVQVYGMLGRDAKNVGVAPIKGWSMSLYPTDVDAAASSNAVVGTTPAPKTDANGLVTFKFLRKNDYSPNKLVVDGIVFAKVAAPGAGYAVDGETVIEIPWSNLDSLIMAPDTFDAVYNNLVVKVHVNEIDSDTLAGWDVVGKIGADTTAAGTLLQTTDADGDVYFNMTGVPGSYPYKAFFRLANTQAGAGTHGWTQTPNGGATIGRYVSVTWDGTVFGSDTLEAGIESVKYLDSDIMVQVHHEKDDTMGYTVGDGVALGGLGVDVDLRVWNTAGTSTSFSATGNAVSGVGTVTFANQLVSKKWQLRARAGGVFDVLNDTIMDLTLDGSDQVYMHDPIGGSGPRWSTFMVKTNNNQLVGRVRSRYGATDVPGMIVTVAPTAMNIQGTAAKVDTTDSGGWYSLAGLREGPYTITVNADGKAYSFLRTLKTTASPAASSITSGSANNDSPTQATRDLEGTGVSQASWFEAYRNDTKFQGLVVNDRDTDLTTIDPGEGLAGAVINLYRDDDGSAVVNVADTLIGSSTTDANGAYSFTGLLEGRYTAVAVPATPNADVQVLTSLSNVNVASTKVTATPLMGANIGASGSLPAWNYANPSAPSNLAPANFTFVYSNTVVRGTVKKQAAGNAPVANMTVQLYKCYASTANAIGPNLLTNVSGPVPDDGGATTCTTLFISGTSATTTDAAGNWSFAGLREGVYRVIPQLASVVPAYGNFVGISTNFAASPGVDDNRPGLFLTVGSGDIESLDIQVW